MAGVLKSLAMQLCLATSATFSVEGSHRLRARRPRRHPWCPWCATPPRRHSLRYRQDGDGTSASPHDEIVDAPANGGAEIVNLLKTGSAFYAPAVTRSRWPRDLKDKKRVVLRRLSTANKG